MLDKWRAGAAAEYNETGGGKRPVPAQAWERYPDEPSPPRYETCAQCDEPSGRCPCECERCAATFAEHEGPGADDGCDLQEYSRNLAGAGPSFMLHLCCADTFFDERSS